MRIYRQEGALRIQRQEKGKAAVKALILPVVLLSALAGWMVMQRIFPAFSDVLSRKSQASVLFSILPCNLPGVPAGAHASVAVHKELLSNPAVLGLAGNRGVYFVNEIGPDTLSLTATGPDAPSAMALVERLAADYLSYVKQVIAGITTYPRPEKIPASLQELNLELNSEISRLLPLITQRLTANQNEYLALREEYHALSKKIENQQPGRRGPSARVNPEQLNLDRVLEKINLGRQEQNRLVKESASLVRLLADPKKNLIELTGTLCRHAAEFGSLSDMASKSGSLEKIQLGTLRVIGYSDRVMKPYKPAWKEASFLYTGSAAFFAGIFLTLCLGDN